MDTVLLTGATGALGMHTAARLRRHLPGVAVLRLGRVGVAAADGSTVHGDLGAPALGNPGLGQQLRRVTTAIHMAADVRWNLPLRKAVAVNAVGTWWLLRLLREAAPGLRRFIYVSTAFAEAPSRCGHCRPSLDVGGRSYSNTYEFSKWLAERYVRRAGIPWVIVRPTLIVGDSRTGMIARYAGIYQLLHLLVRGRLPFLVGDPDGYVDTVPVDLVARAVVDLVALPGADGHTVPVCAADGAPRLHEVVTRCVEEVNAYRARHGVGPIEGPAFVGCEKYRRLLYPLMEPELAPGQRRFLHTVDLFHPYLGLPSPLRVRAGSPAYRGGSFLRYGERIVRAWCERHRALALADPRTWRARNAEPDYEVARTG